MSDEETEALLTSLIASSLVVSGFILLACWLSYLGL